MGTKNELEVRVNNIFRTKGFSDIDIEFVTGSEKGDGIIGNLSNAKICAVKEGVPQEFNVVIKFAPTDTTFRKTMPARNLFLREIGYYNNIAPIYENLQDQELRVPQEIRCFLPKFYGSCDDLKEETIILEDLNKKGFSVTPHQVLDYDHAAIILRNIAKLHALSFIYENRYPKTFKEVADPCIYILDLPNGECDKKYIVQHGEKTMKQFTGAITDGSLRRRFEKAAGTNAVEKLSELVKTGNVKALLHGDNWLGNHMFQYENGKPTEVMPMDFQWSIYSSIGYDFMYMFSFAVSKGLITSKFYQLVDKYYAELKNFLSVCGYDSENFCSYEQLKEELKGQALTSLVDMVATPFFLNPNLTLPELLSSPEAYAVTEEYNVLVNEKVTAWAGLGFI